jgi:hypothetical protein
VSGATGARSRHTCTSEWSHRLPSPVRPAKLHGQPRQLYFIVPAQAVVAKWLATFKEFPGSIRVDHPGSAELGITAGLAFIVR